jgi:hypothetical protein
MIRIKPGARIRGLCTECAFGSIICALALKEQFDRDFTLTSGNDGHHSRASLHYDGKAVDFRSHELLPAEKNQFLAIARVALGEDFDLILEAEGTDNEHFHLEWQPKGP